MIAFHAIVDSAWPSIIFYAWWAVLCVSGFIGLVFAGAVIAEGAIEEIPWCAACLVVAMIAVYKIGGM